MTLNINTLIVLVVQVVLIVAAYSGFKARTTAVLTSNQSLVEQLTKRFEDHETEDNRRFEVIQERDEKRYEILQARFMDLVGSVQRLIGQAEQRARTRP